MVIKFISVGLALCALELFIVGLQSPADPLYLIISNNPFVVTLRILLIFASVVLAFKASFKYRSSRRIVAATGALLVVFGATGMLSQTVTNEFSVFIKYLDFWMIFLLGIVFSLSALSYPAGKAKLHIPSLLIRKLPKALAAKVGKPANIDLGGAKKSRA